MSTSTWIVEGMTCQHCVGVITKAIRMLDDTAQVAVDLAAGEVRVASSLPAQLLVQAMVDEGYPARLYPS